METFNKKSLCVALAATGMLGAAGVAQAVNVSADGLGNVLIYPYYTTKKDINANSFNTLMSVVNTTLSTKAVKVRFREGKNSEEVLDFNVFLSPYDVWTAAVTPTADGGAQIATTDTSCTIPKFTSGVPVAFRTTQLESGDNGVARTAEGYFEVFEMATYTDASIIGVNAKHSGGVPKDCSKVTDTVASLEQQAPNGGLFGGLTILSPAGGGMFTQDATALANFSTVPAYATTGSTAPTYANASPAISNVIVDKLLYQSSWAAGTPLAVTAALMAERVTNEYVLDVGSKSATTWILTFPTKQPHVNGASAPIKPFTSKYVSKVGACENFYGVVFDREESSPQIITGTDFSPQPAPGAGPQLCWEAQSVGFGTSNVFGSSNHNSIATPYSNGWSTLGFNGILNTTEHTLVNAAATTVVDLTGVAAPVGGLSFTYYGLPVIGFAAQTFQNDAITISGKTYLSTFGATFSHHGTKKVSP